MTSKLPTILCVDDDPGILDLFTEFLTSQGYDVLTAANGVETSAVLMPLMRIRSRQRIGADGHRCPVQAA